MIYIKLKIVNIIVFLCIILCIMSCNFHNNKPVQFNKEIWNSWDIMYDERRYNMTIYFFRENWFNGKTKDIILDELLENNKINHINHFYNINSIENNILLFDLKYSNEFMERWNIDFDFKPIAYLKLYFNENNQLIKAELYEGKRKMAVNKYKIKKYWEIE